MMRNGGAEIFFFPLRTSGDGGERRRRRDAWAERWMDEGLLRRHKVRLRLETAGWSHQNYAELPRKAHLNAGWCFVLFFEGARRLLLSREDAGVCGWV